MPMAVSSPWLRERAVKEGTPGLRALDLDRSVIRRGWTKNPTASYRNRRYWSQIAAQ
jgi:hypothetical protein